MIEVSNLRKEYTIKNKIGVFRRRKEKFCAVENISLNISEGQIVGLLGVNGAGKTTTIRMLSGLLKPTSGQYIFDGIDAVESYEKIKSKINVISGGERNLYWRISVKENLIYFGSLYGLKGKILTNTVEKLIDYVGLTSKRDVPVENLSKGMKQRLQFARGLINDPKYIFLDEPTLGLDVTVANQLRDDIKSLVKERKKGVLLTTHYMHEAEHLCDYIYIVDKGKIIMEDSIDSIKKIMKSQEKILIEVDNIKDISNAFYNNSEFNLIGSTIVTSVKLAEQVIKVAADKGNKILSYSSKPFSLEDFVIEATSNA
ncbi:ABC transporter (fragment) [Vibrio nigripulchritudo SFn27]|uniref:ABC-type multidrug transport system, ATPase component n=1 Tax=Vibrio nigripulchritudo TaxID=28173 RepID=A0A9P1NJY1_9VIBR